MAYKGIKLLKHFFTFAAPLQISRIKLIFCSSVVAGDDFCQFVPITKKRIHTTHDVVYVQLEMVLKYAKKILEFFTKRKIRGKVFHEIYESVVTPAQKFVSGLPVLMVPSFRNCNCRQQLCLFNFLFMVASFQFYKLLKKFFC